MEPSDTPAKTLNKRGQHDNKLKRGYSSVGCRKPGKRGYMGRRDWCRPIVQATVIWSDMEGQQGHEIFREDLLKHFLRLLTSAVAFAQDKEDSGTLTPEEAEEKAMYVRKLNKLLTSQKQRNWQSQYLAGKADLVTRRKQRTTSLTSDQERQKGKHEQR